MQPFSEKLSNLAARTKQLEDRAAASRSATRETLESNVSDAKASVSKARDDLQSHIDTASDQAPARWQQAQGSIDTWAEDLKHRRAERETERNLERALEAADQADEDAAAAVDFAIYAVASAEYAVLDAVDQRLVAEAMPSPA
jgi:predicted  nucleic acid-binding Zn-ribbon protein